MWLQTHRRASNVSITECSVRNMERMSDGSWIKVRIWLEWVGVKKGGNYNVNVDRKRSKYQKRWS